MSPEETDDLMPNEAEVSSFYVPPENQEQVQEVQAERAMVQSAGPMFQEILGWFNQEQAWANSIDGLDAESEIPIESQLIAKQRYANFLKAAIGRLETLKGEHLS